MSLQRSYLLITLLFISASFLQTWAQAKGPLEVADLFRINRISDPALSKGGE